MGQSLSSVEWVDRLRSTDRVLLINPPVQEVRYAWVKWNQPTDLLQLSSKLKAEVGCEVALLDFMLPDSGRVAMRDLGKHRVVGETVFKTRMYGLPIQEATRRLLSVVPTWTPTHIVLSTLTTYWYEGSGALIPLLKSILPDTPITLIGPYAVFEREHASKLNADVIIPEFLHLADYVPDFKVYFHAVSLKLHDGRTVAFGGLKFTRSETAKNLLYQVKTLQSAGVRDFCIMEENIFYNNCEILHDFFDLLYKSSMSINLYGICGIQPKFAKPGIYTKMAKCGYKSLFIEYELDGVELNLDAYRHVYLEAVKDSAVKFSSGNLGGFIMVGTPQDDLETMFEHSFQLLEIFGSIIPKPYTPSPGTEHYTQLSKRGLHWLSPHVYPMSEISDISREDYREFFQHTSFLNEKRSGTSFDYFDHSYSTVALQRSLAKKGDLNE